MKIWVKGQFIEVDRVVKSIDELMDYLKTNPKNEMILLDEAGDIR